MSSATTMNVDIISDVVCPWCVVAYRQLTCAAAQLDQPLELNVRWHPFELNPQMASGGQDLHEHAQEKYGTTLAQNTQGRERLQREGQMVGITFNYSDASRIYNTFSAHQLLHWQQGSPKQQTALKEALFDAYFTAQRDVSDEHVLLDVVTSVGLSRGDAMRILADSVYASAVREGQRSIAEQGVQGVPAIVLDERYSVPGAQSVETFANILTRVLKKRANA